MRSILPRSRKTRACRGDSGKQGTGMLAGELKRQPDRKLCDGLVGEGEGQGYVRLELGGVVAEAIGLVAPGADGFGGGGG